MKGSSLKSAVSKLHAKQRLLIAFGAITTLFLTETVSNYKMYLINTECPLSTCVKQTSKNIPIQFWEPLTFSLPSSFTVV